VYGFVAELPTNSRKRRFASFSMILSRFLGARNLAWKVWDMRILGFHYIGLCNIRKFPKFELQSARNFPILVTKVSGNTQTGALPL